MSNITFEMEIPVDNDGYVEFECDFCKERFMLEKNEFQDMEMPFFFCPICGLPNGVNTFYCPEVIEKARQIASEWAMQEIQRKLGATIKSINKSGFVKMNIKTQHKERKMELYQAINDYVLHKSTCCNAHVKIKEIDQQIGVYCPICGGTEI